ncbi:Methionine ABC transporter ATP-binding protein [Rhodococcus wratislaviensis]|uniref:Methionine ABC transporter ATP-binding protein n=1 Tax=Rhodococcus wratislaviensis TaxID=44752 RepID=A0A402CJY0_RHOWR|nr:Methionine ABC transporter ATP-binding protein [Rhodococcus wratislaviensis]
MEGIVPQMKATPGMPFRQAVARRQERVRHIMHTLPENAQIAIQESLGADGLGDEWGPGGADTDRMYFETAAFDAGVAK